mmetsp:Transcript_86773/g.151051  ORF Transcript_86773/g.151051 Transcript_86773/m.151051 type:complete len:92 (-) Transcript_86773:80-355(-)
MAPGAVCPGDPGVIPGARDRWPRGHGWQGGTGMRRHWNGWTVITGTLTRRAYRTGPSRGGDSTLQERAYLKGAGAAKWMEERGPMPQTVSI